MADEKPVTEKTLWERNHEALKRLDKKGELYHEPNEKPAPAPKEPKTTSGT